MIPIANIVERLRTKADLPEDAEDFLSQDGTLYTIPLSFKPVISGSESVYIRHTTFTTGYDQFVPRNGTQSGPYFSGNNLTYNINYSRGKINFYQGSGTIFAPTGLVPFAPWATSTVTVYYQKAKYTDKVLSDYVSFAVAPVEASLQIGMYVSGTSGVAPTPRQYTDSINYLTAEPYGADEKYIITEDVEILQHLIAQKAAWDLASRERRVGAGNAIRLKDGDTEIDTAGGQRWVADYVKDMKLEYTDTLKFVMIGMSEGYSLRQINEISSRLYYSNLGNYNWGTYQ